MSQKTLRYISCSYIKSATNTAFGAGRIENAITTGWNMTAEICVSCLKDCAFWQHGSHWVAPPNPQKLGPKIRVSEEGHRLAFPSLLYKLRYIEILALVVK